MAFLRYKMIDIAIVAGGLGQRLYPVTRTIPKAMVDINGEPFVAHQLRLLRSGGITRVVMCIGHLGEQIRSFVGNGSQFGLEVAYSFDGATLRGTGGAIREARPLLSSDFFVLYGDSYLPCDYRALATAFREARKPGLMTVYCNDGRWDSSNVELRDGRIIDYDKEHRSSQMRHIDYGLGVFKQEAFDSVGAEGSEGSYDLADVYRNLLLRDDLAAYEVDERFYEVGSQSGIKELCELLSIPSSVSWPRLKTNG